uniref:Glutamate--tRNA ligase 2 n=1 Tax=Lygus hesperus TaxID=30085 RepID=A0A0A9Z5A2_LYGHE
MMIDSNKPRFLCHKSTYSGAFNSAVITLTTKQMKTKRNQDATLDPAYSGPLTIKKAKLEDLKHLKQFLINPIAHSFYEALATDENDSGEAEVEYLDDPPIDDTEH